MTRKQALIVLRDKVKAGEWEDGPSSLDQEALGIDLTRLAHAAYHDSLNAAKVLHEAVLHEAVEATFVWSARYGGKVKLHFRGEDIGFGRSNDNLARAWLLAILEALITQEIGQ